MTVDRKEIQSDPRNPLDPTLLAIPEPLDLRLVRHLGIVSWCDRGHVPRQDDQEDEVDDEWWPKDVATEGWPLVVEEADDQGVGQ